MFVSLLGIPIWRLHTELCKFVWNTKDPVVLFCRGGPFKHSYRFLLCNVMPIIFLLLFWHKGTQQYAQFGIMASICLHSKSRLRAKICVVEFKMAAGEKSECFQRSL